MPAATVTALRARRLPLLLLGALSLLAGILAGLARMGVAVPQTHADLALLHGPLMLSGFFGTVIGLERAVALGRPWPYAAPLSSGLGGVLLAAGFPVALGASLLVLGAGVLAAALFGVWRAHRAGFTAALAAAAACWLVGNTLWLAGASMPAVVAWWILFLVLTIAGERLELSRFRPANRWSAPAFAAAVALMLAGALLAAVPDLGYRILGAGLLALALWLARFDIARRTIRGNGLPRFVAACLLSGYVWLGAAGALAMLAADPTLGAAYDALLHALFLGFVFAMVFGHAPIILPAVLRVAVPYRPVLYLPLAALHFGVALRVAGDLGDDLALRQCGGIANAAAIALFILTVLALTAARRRAPPPI